MKHIWVFLLFATALFAQGGGQPINIPIPNPNFDVGYGSTIIQDLGVTPSQLQENTPGYTTEGLYTLTLPANSESGTYPGYFKMKISFGTQEMCEGSGWGLKAQSQVVIICGSPGYLIVDQSLDCDQNPCTVGPAGSAQGKHNLVLTLTGNGWATNFNNVSLTFTPTN